MATVTKETVAAAADALEARGLKVSVRTVRDHLGGGSPNQITPLLAAWREKKPQVAQADIQLDPRIGQLIAEQVRVAAGESARRADERATEAEDTLQQDDWRAATMHRESPGVMRVLAKRASASSWASLILYPTAFGG